MVLRQTRLTLSLRIHPRRFLSSLYIITSARDCRKLFETDTRPSFTSIKPFISPRLNQPQHLSLNHNKPPHLKPPTRHHFITMASPPSKYITLPSGRTLEYNLSGPENSPTVLLANSLCAPYQAWNHIIPLIHSLGYRTLNYNQPGHGNSSSPPDLKSTTLASLADDAAYLLQSQGIEKLHAWIGVSMGAATSIYVAARHPGKIGKLIICDSISCSPGNAGVPDVFTQRVQSAREAGTMHSITEGTLQRWFGDAWLVSHPEEASRMRDIMNTTTLDGFETCCAALSSDSFDMRPLFGKVGSGVDEALLVVGEKDANLPQTMAVMRDEIEKGFREAGKDGVKPELRVIQDAGHVCFVDGLEEFKKQVLTFL